MSNEYLSFTVEELNEIIYCIGFTRGNGKLVNKELSKNLHDRFYTALQNMTDGSPDYGPEYDSAGYTDEDRIVDGQYQTNETELQNALRRLKEYGAEIENFKGGLYKVENNGIWGLYNAGGTMLLDEDEIIELADEYCE